MGFLLADVTPDFIALHVLDGDIHQQLAHDAFAVLASVFQHRQHRPGFHTAQARRGAHAIAFQQAMEDRNHYVLLNTDIFPEGPVVRFGVPLSALLALVPLEFVSAFTSLHHVGFAVVARHCEISC